MNTNLAILYSFRRCPYAMRARLAIQSSGIKVQLREIVLRDKASEFLASSPKGTVPILIYGNKVIEESLGVMQWALSQADPEGWLKVPEARYDWISRNDGPFKTALDRTKYSERFPNLDANLEQEKAAKFLEDLNSQIGDSPWMFGTNCSLVDMAIIPFVRQFSKIDSGWFNAQGWQNLHRWLNAFLNSSRFNLIMDKYDKWVPGNPIVSFPREPKTIFDAAFHHMKF